MFPILPYPILSLLIAWILFFKFSHILVFLLLLFRTHDIVHSGISASVCDVNLPTGMDTWLAHFFISLLCGWGFQDWHKMTWPLAQKIVAFKRVCMRVKKNIIFQSYRPTWFLGVICILTRFSEDGNNSRLFILFFKHVTV